MYLISPNGDAGSIKINLNMLIFFIRPFTGADLSEANTNIKHGCVSGF